MARASSLELFHPAVAEWLTTAFGAPTRPQALGWPPIARGESTLILSPTGSGKTLAAFLWCLNRLLFEPVPPTAQRCRVLYVSPLKALAVDVERNLRAPLAGIARVAESHATGFTTPAVAVRTGDTPAAERARFQKEPADILITTPESLFLLLSSAARARLASIDTVIIDEIHALVGTKRGAHLAVSLERLEVLAGRRLQRIGLSATQRPLDEVARFLGGADPRALPRARKGRLKPAPTTGGWKAVAGAGVSRPGDVDALATVRDELRPDVDPDEQAPAFRPVTIIDAREKKRIALHIEVPVEDMAKLAQPIDLPSGPAAQGPVRASIWSAIHPRLLALIQAHTSTLVFVNSRRLAERLAGALNELAGEPLVRAHHGSIARAQRSEIEDLLKAGRIRGLVATSSLELGIDMGAIDLVVQIEAPPSVASGLQRIGRAGHQLGAVSNGVVFPKFRGDLVACAATARAMHEGAVEATHYPRNPLDVLAQQIVGMVAMDRWEVDELFVRLRCAAPFATLTRRVFEGVLDMLSGRYPSDEFAELRPRLTWDRVNGTLEGREGVIRTVIANAGTIPDRGLYGVFLAGAGKGAARVGELDEEMVFETHVGETFVLGASSWRIEEITHDRVLVSPAPGEPGKMPFWKGDQAGRPAELGRAIGKLVRELGGTSRPAAIERLTREHDLDRVAAENLLQYLDDQAAAGVVPDDRTIVIERCLDELGDWRVCVLSPLGGRVHAPWAMAVTAHVRQLTGLDVETLWGDDGFVVRFPELASPPDPALMLPDVDEVEGLVMRQLGSTALFAARFREIAARSLLLPRRRPGQRVPLWQQRKRASDLLSVASRYGSFPAILETYRECLRDFFDMATLVDTLRQLRARRLRSVTVDSRTPSPFAASVLFTYVANFLYDGDAPLAERRAQALSVDQAQLRELLGDAELRELLDADALDSLERQMQALEDGYRARSIDGLHDLLLRIGDLTREEIAARSTTPEVAADVDTLLAARRVLDLRIAGERRLAAVEDAARYRDALGTPLPAGVPEALLEPVRDPLGDLLLRYARTHAPFTTGQIAARFGLGRAVVETMLTRLVAGGRLLEGEFRPGGMEREWCDADVLRTLRRRSLARLRQEVEPVDGAALGRLATVWQGVQTRRQGLEALLDTIEQLQGAAVAASILERDVLPARIEDFSADRLDTLMAAGEVTWVGVEAVGEHDGRVALYLTDHLPRLLPRPLTPPELDARQQEIVAYLRAHGASFFTALHHGTGAGFPNDTVDALWDLVWKGIVSNDTLHALRAYVRAGAAREKRRDRRGGFRSRRLVPPAAEGRWSLVDARRHPAVSVTEWSAAVAQQLLSRHGVITRETIASENLPGGFGAVYPALKAMEERGRIRRGYFVAGLGAAQFAMPAAVDLLRSLRDEPEEVRTVTLAATDPANPYGAVLRWPLLPGTSADEPGESTGRGPTRSVGPLVILVNGAAAAYLRKGQRELIAFVPEHEPARSRVGLAIAHELRAIARRAEEGQRGMLLAEVNGEPAADSPLARYLAEAGFAPSAMGMQLRIGRRSAVGGGRSSDVEASAVAEPDDY